MIEKCKFFNLPLTKRRADVKLLKGNALIIWAEGNMNMKIGMTSLTLKEHEIEEVISCAKSAGLCGIEWGVADRHVVLNDKSRVQKIRKISEKVGLQIFSLGSYCRMEDKQECKAALDTALLLGAPVIRVWAGKRSPCECDEAYVKKIVANSVYMADLAAKHNIKIGFEYHNHTLTENSESAVSFIKKVGRKNAGLYWQPNSKLTAKENKREMDAVLPYIVGNFHIHNFSVENGYESLKEIEDEIKAYFTDIKDGEYNLLIEFVKDASVKNLRQDAEFLTKLFV